MSGATIKDIAEATNVSLASVSLVLSGKGRISPAVRGKILEAAKELGYVREERRKSKASPAPLGILFSIDLSWGMAWWLERPLVEQLESEFRARGRTLVMLPMTLEMDDETILAKIGQSRCEAVFSLHFARESIFSRLESQGLPVVLIMNGSFQDRFCSILVDDYQGAYEGASHLLKLGHRDILYVDTERQGLQVLSQDRFIGFRKALEEKGIELPPERHLRFVADDDDYLESLIRGAFAAENRPTAIFALDDDIAARIVPILRSMGLGVPEDVSIIAPGDVIKYGGPNVTPITTMRINTQLMGKIAADMMAERLANPKGEMHVIKIKQQLVQRGSMRAVSHRPSASLRQRPSGRERVLAVLERKPSTAVPRWLGVSAEFLRRARTELGLDEESFRRRFRDDFRRIEAEYPNARSLRVSGESIIGPFGIERRGSGYGQGVTHPLDAYSGAKALHEYPWPDPELVDVSKMRNAALAYNGEFALVGGDPSPFWHDAVDLLGMESLAFLMYDDPDFVAALLKKILEYYLAVTTRIFEEAGDLIDLFFIRNNFGTQTGPLLGEKHFGRFIVPCLRKLSELGHRYGIKVMLHSAGSFRPLIPMIVDSGIDALHPIQPDCAGMGGAGLKRDFGDSLVLCGGIDARNLVLPGPPSRIRQGTLEVLHAMAPGGGYIASASVEAFLDDTAPEYVLTMGDAIEEFSPS